MRRMSIAVALCLAALVVGARVRAQEHLYVGADKCRSCHKKELIGDQYGKWKEGPHAKAFETLRGQKAIDIAKKKGISAPPHEAPECLKCHVTAYGVKPAAIKYPLDRVDGIQCESCHGPGNDYRKKSVMSDHDKSVAKGLRDPGEDQKVCTSCHNQDSPTVVSFDFEKAKKEIEHPIPKDVKGRVVEIEKERRSKK